MVVRDGGAAVPKSYVYFASSPAIDVDGAPTAYSSKDATKQGSHFVLTGEQNGIDSPISAAVAFNKKTKTFLGWSENCVVLSKVLGKDADKTNYGEPEVDGDGFCYGKTTLYRKGLAETDRERYVDALRVPYFVLPPNPPVYAAIGTYGFFISTLGGYSGAMFADGGPKREIGEVSWCLAKLLRLPGGARGVAYPKGTKNPLPLNIFGVVLPGATGQKPDNAAGMAVDMAGRLTFQRWGGYDALEAAVAKMSSVAKDAYRLATAHGAGAGGIPLLA